MTGPDPLDDIANQAYLEVMGSTGILGILWNRETISEARLLSLTPAEVTDLYDTYIAPAIDKIEAALMSPRQ